MSANVICYVRVLRGHEEVVEVSALTLDEAIIEAGKLSGVLQVVDASYGDPRKPKEAS
jgi:hypothetical protein